MITVNRPAAPGAAAPSSPVDTHQVSQAAIAVRHGGVWRRGWLLFRITLWAAAALLIASIAFTIVLSLDGQSSYVVRGTSMQPTIRPGSLVITRPVPAAQVRPMDVIVVAPRWAQLGAEPKFIIHRLLRVTPTEDGVFGYTWGDGTALPDPEPALLGNDVPVVETVIPLLGHLYGLMPSGAIPALALLVILPLLLLTTSTRPIARSTRRVSPALR